jgi:molybdopterin converting factor small subunit
LARIGINFVGLWRIFLGERSITVEVGSINEARDYIETNYGPAFQKKLETAGVNKKQSIWDNSNVLLNGKNIDQLDAPVLKDGDKLDLLSKVAGG